MIRSFNGKTPKIAESAFISEVAYVIGDVEIGENSSVWPGTVVRGDNGRIKIGANTAIEDNSVLHDATEIGDNVVIGHSVVVHHCQIGNNTLVGSHATILDNVQIGSFCIIAGGCVVTPRMKIPDNSFVVGVPAEIKGEISQEQRSGLERGAFVFNAKLARQHKEQGF
ncbi:MAG: gamma carbonic anhydrase family protein [Chloroflexi bacterium]|nr:gamma carbonic anhydrase family protein [Chloroflexota bacterium]